MPITRALLKIFHQLSFQRQADQPLLLVYIFLVHTIFKVKQTGLTDVLQLAARLAYFCFLETHTNTRAPAKYCERPGTNLKDRKSTLVSLSHSNEVTILVLARKLEVQTHLLSLNHKYNFFILVLRFRPREVFVSVWCLTLTGESFREVFFLLFFQFITITRMLKADLLKGNRNSPSFQEMSV